MEYFIRDLKVNTQFYRDRYRLDIKYVKIDSQRIKCIDTNVISKYKKNEKCFSENL